MAEGHGEGDIEKSKEHIWQKINLNSEKQPNKWGSLLDPTFI